MKVFILNAIDTIKDKRWSFGFKILNILTNDRLRLELMFTDIYIKEAFDACAKYMENRPLKSHIERNLSNARNHINEIWRNKNGKDPF